MDDRLSTLPDDLLCHILSFLSTKECVATSVLSKRWIPLWRFIPILDFYDVNDILNGDFNSISYLRFVEWVHSIIRYRDPNQPIKKFCIRPSLNHFEDKIIYEFVDAAVRCGVEQLHLSLHQFFPTSVLCRTLVVLKLTKTFIMKVLSVDLPSLKILHLHSVYIAKAADLALLISGCPLLEDLESDTLRFIECSFSSKSHLKILPKLVRAHLSGSYVPLEVVSNVQVLRLNMGILLSQIFKTGCKYLIFSNLVHLELCYLHYAGEKDLRKVICMLHHCPKLQYLALNKWYGGRGMCGARIDNRPYPIDVPHCIFFHLKTCLIGLIGLVGCVCGSPDELKFAKYVMWNARFLREMTIRSPITKDEEGEDQMLKELSLCTRPSSSSHEEEVVKTEEA